PLAVDRSDVEADEGYVGRGRHLLDVDEERLVAEGMDDGPDHRCRTIAREESRSSCQGLREPIASVAADDEPSRLEACQCPQHGADWLAGHRHDLVDDDSPCDDRI